MKLGGNRCKVTTRDSPLFFRVIIYFFIHLAGLELAIQPDYVHLLLRGDPSTAPSDMVRFMKGRSSRVLREEFPELLKLPSLWTQSFFLSTASLGLIPLNPNGCMPSGT